MIPEEQRLKQFGESAKKQKEELEARKCLPKTFAWTAEVAEYYKKKETAQTANKQRKPRWLPEKHASLVTFQDQLKNKEEQRKRVHLGTQPTL